MPPFPLESSYFKPYCPVNNLDELVDPDLLGLHNLVVVEKGCEHVLLVQPAQHVALKHVMC